MEKDFEIKNGVLTRYTGAGGDVVIPEGVTKIDGWAFSNCTGLTSISIPEGVKEIGDGAFAGCKDLTSITIPEGVEKIDWHTFYNCISLISVTIPEGVTAIGQFAFSLCEKLTRVTLPQSVTKIDKRVFEVCPIFQLIAPHIPIEQFDKQDKPSACCGFALAWLEGWQMEPGTQAGYLKYIKGQKKRLYPAAVQREELLQLMMAEKMITRKDIDLLLEECDKQKNTATKAVLLDYINKNLKPVDPLKEFKL